MKLVWHPVSQPAFRTFFSKGQGKPVQFTRIKCSPMHLSNTARKCPLYQHTLLVVELWLKLSFRWVDRAALHHFCIVFHLHTGAAVHLPFWTLVPLCPVNRTKTFFNRFAPLLLPQSPQLCKHPLIACKLSKAQQIPFCVELNFLPCTVRSSFLTRREPNFLNPVTLPRTSLFLNCTELEVNRLGICEGGVLSVQSAHLCAGLGKE